LFTIKQVSEMTDTPPHTLRFWEKEFEGILTPLRTKGGQRRYRREHVTLIERIKELKSQGASLNRIRTSLFHEENGHASQPKALEHFVECLVEVIRKEIYTFLEQSLGESDRPSSETVLRLDGDSKSGR